MIKIQFPKNRVTTRQKNNFTEIFDPIRKKWLLLSPEEWVRQNMICFIISKNYPASLIAIEKETRRGELSRRCDVVVYSKNMKPFMIIECKEMNVTLSQKTIDQILRYHITLPATFLIITNGKYCFGFEKKENQFFEINTFPEYEL